MTMRAASARRPVRASSTRCRRRPGKMPGSRCASAAGVAPADPRVIPAAKPAARMISTGTDGHDVTTKGSFTRLSNDAGGPQLLDAGRAIAEPLAVDERVVLADGGRRTHTRRARVG